MSDHDRPDFRSHPSFVATHQLSRRQLIRLSAAAGGAMLVGGLAPSFARQAAAQDGTPAAPATDVTGGPIEVGVLYEEGAWFDHVKSIGDSLEADYADTKIKYTFANTASDPARALRWQNGDPLDVDTGRWSNQAPPTWDWVNNGFVLDMAPYVNAPLASGDVWGDTFTQGAKSFSIDSRADSTTPGAWWGVPYESVLMLVHYNVQIFEDLGITPPTTWAEFLTVCETINTQGADKGIKPICVSGPTNAYCAHWWDRMTQRVVGREAVDAVLYGDAKVADNPGFLTAAQELSKLQSNGWFMDGYQGADFTGAQALFFQGKAAMIHMGSWLAAEMADVIPEGFRLGVFDFPTYDGGAGDQNAMFGTAQIWSIANPEKSSSHEVNVPLAVEYLKRWTSVERETERSTNLRMIPTVNGVPAPTGTTGMEEMVTKSATSDVIIYYYAAHWDTGLSTAWWNPIQALFLGQASPEQMIEMLDKNLDEYRKLKAAGA